MQCLKSDFEELSFWRQVATAWRKREEIKSIIDRGHDVYVPVSSTNFDNPIEQIVDDEMEVLINLRKKRSKRNG